MEELMRPCVVWDNRPPDVLDIPFDHLARAFPRHPHQHLDFMLPEIEAGQSLRRQWTQVPISVSETPVINRTMP